MTVPADVSVPNDPGVAGAAVNYPAPTTDGGTQPVVVDCSHASGAFYPLGVTTVSCTATDGSSEPAQLQRLDELDAVVTDSFTITVVDVEPPTIADKPDLTITTSGAGPVQVAFTPPAADDNSGVPPTVVCAPPTGWFPLGTTAVTCTATDSSGLSASSTFDVYVVQVAGPSSSPPEGPPRGSPGGPSGGPPGPIVQQQGPETGGSIETPLAIALIAVLASTALLALSRRRDVERRTLARRS